MQNFGAAPPFVFDHKTDRKFWRTTLLFLVCKILFPKLQEISDASRVTLNCQVDAADNKTTDQESILRFSSWSTESRMSLSQINTPVLKPRLSRQWRNFWLPHCSLWMLHILSIVLMMGFWSMGPAAQPNGTWIAMIVNCLNLFPLSCGFLALDKASILPGEMSSWRETHTQKRIDTVRI